MIHSVADILRWGAVRCRDMTALITAGDRTTYAVLDAKSDRLAAALIQSGLVAGERVAVAAGNGPELVVALFGVWKAGGIVLHLDPALSPQTLLRLLGGAGARTLVADAANAALGAALAEDPGPLTRILVCGRPSPHYPRAAPGLTVESLAALLECGGSRSLPAGASPQASMDMLACISYTSGSTGEPRGVRLSHRNLIRNAELNVRYLGISPADRVCLVLPLHFGMNRTSLLACFLAGATVVLENGMLDPNGLLATMRREAVTSLSAVPSVVATLLGRGDWRATRVPSLRSVRIGAGRVTAPMLQGLQLAFPGVQVYLTYGLTEVGLVAVLPPQQAMAKPQSCGQVLPEIRLRVLPPAGRPGANGEGGEIVILAPHIAQGYEEDPEGTRAIFQADGVHTGDLGWLDSEGFLHLTGRAKELIKRGSENINPREIEEYLLRHPAVAECAVIGVPDPWLGEAVKAFVVPAPGHALANGELRRFCLRGLSPIKRPSQIVCCSSLPRGAAGKVDKQALHQHEARSRTEIREDTPGPGDPHGRHRRLLEDHG